MIAAVGHAPAKARVAGPWSNNMLAHCVCDALQHHVGRYQDSALALPDDQEVSGKHAVILFSASERRWKLVG